MEENATLGTTNFLKTDKISKNKLFMGAMFAAVILGLVTGYMLSSNPNSKSAKVVGSIVQEKPKSAQQDNQTFRDFAEGTLVLMPAPKKPTDYVDGTHLLKRDGATPVALTSSVVDLSQYEGKKVKVFGETQKAVKAGWLMDVGKVEVIQ